MGKSYKTKRDVFPTIMAAFPNTAKLAFWSILVAVAIALPIGIISATRQYSAIDNVGMVAALLGVATPNFWLGLMLIIVFSLNLGWLPSGGMGEGRFVLFFPTELHKPGLVQHGCVGVRKAVVKIKMEG